MGYGTFSEALKTVSLYSNDSTELDDLQDIYSIVAKTGKAPLVPMTKAEYYANWIKKHQATAAQNAAQIKSIRDSKDPYLDEETKKKMAEQYESLIAIEEQFISAIIAVRNRLSPEQLAKPALTGEESGAYFETPSFDESRFYILKHNPDYYNTKLPKAALQLYSIALHGGQKVLYYQFKQTDARKAVDQLFFDELQRISAIGLLEQNFKPLIQN